jgi:hypothetical protein
MNTATAEATGFIRRMVKDKSGEWGKAEALRLVARDSKLSFWTLNNLRIGRAKTVDADVRDRIRQAFIEHCRGHAARLLHDAETAAAKGNKNEVLDDIEDQIRALAARLEAAKSETERRR